MPAVTTIPPGAKGADYVKLTPEILAWLKANGCTFVSRYIARTTRIGKIITPEEVRTLHANGIAVALVFEENVGDTNGGAARGFANGQWSRQFALELGYPAGLPLSAAADTDIYSGNIDAAVAYMEAFRTGLAPTYKLGMYADADLGRRVPCDRLCIPNAKGWSRSFWQRVAAGLPWGLDVHILQGRAIYPPGVDPLTVYKAFDAWLPTPDPPKPPPTPILPTVRFGSRGEPVRVLQRALGVRVDGWFGPQTRTAVLRFQRANKLKADGIVGPQTWAKITRRTTGVAP
jgi:hypothetical protein